MQRLKTTAALLTTLLLVTLLSSCGDSHEKVSEDTIEQMDEFFAVMTTVKDRESAAAANEKLDAIIANLEQIADRYEALDEPDDATRETINEKFKKFGETKQKELEAQTEELGANGVAIMMTMMASMKKMSEVMERMPAYEMK